MADIKELFDMVTKQTEPDLDSWKQQEDRQRRSSRNKKIGAYAVAAAFVLIAAIAFAVLRGGEDDALTPATDDGTSGSGTTVVSHAYLDIATGERSPVAVNLGGARLSEVSPNGEIVVFGTCCGSTDAIYVSELTGSSEWISLTPGAMNGYAATWLDDETVLFQGRESNSTRVGDLYTADVATGELTMIVDLPDITSGAWVVRSDVSPDGTTVLFALPRGGVSNREWDLWTVPLTGGEPTLLREDAGFAQYTADGSIVFLDRPIPFEGDDLWVMDGDGSNARELVSGNSLTWPQVSPDGSTVAYGHDGEVEIVDIATGEVTAFDEFADEPAWYGNDMLIVD
jgi:Tol biopolymer transport system component